MRDRITLRNLHFYGHHGVDAAERNLGGRFSLDVELVRDLTRAGETDDLNETVDYKAVYDLVAGIQRQGFCLLEALALNIARGILEAFDVEEVTVRARKQSVPLGGLIDCAEVEVTRRKDGCPNVP
ncbi:MAG: dihydroneopterin aldolase [Armatimonadetes bacterium]|nr:dihydroneopterin aldolase [Armatimonadota bacterium]